MTRPSINDIVGIQDFAVLFRWEIIFSSLPSGLANAAKYSGGILNTHAISSEYPKFSQEEIETSIHGHKVYQAGMITYDPITLTLVETNDALVQSFIRDWGELLWKPNAGTQVSKSQYICPSVILRPLKVDNLSLFEYTLKNVWLQSHTIGNPEGGANETIKPEITLRFDYFLSSGQKA